MKRTIFGCLLLALCVGVAGLSTECLAKRKRKRRNEITKIFRSKARFGRKPKSKRRGKWRKIYTVKARNKLMAETLGKRIPIMCRLTADDSFECEVRGPNKTALVSESAKWPAGRMRLKIHVTGQGITLELSNKWKKHIRTRRKKKKKK